jgi:uncharacterized protein (DUF924 family)
MQKSIADILAFWFGPLSDEGLSKPTQHSLWFNSSDYTDQQCKDRFGVLVERAIAGELDHWAATDEGLIALTLLLDQFPRNIHRGTPAAFAGDPRALALSQQAIVQGRHLKLPLIHRVFLYMPLEHSEDLAVQEQCVLLFSQMVSATGLDQMKDFNRYAVAHRDVIAEFARFPHRNVILGRTSTAAELQHIATHGGF